MTVTLMVRRTIRATPERLFDAWTEPYQLKQWWGPRSVICSEAEIDLSIGGRYRIGNQFPDGKVLFITGEFEIIERPHRLVYTWKVGADSAPPERVMVSFHARGESTEVIVSHERIRDPALRDQHERGWEGCLDGLVRYFTQ